VSEDPAAPPSASETVYHAPRLAACLARLGELHPRLCPRQVLGARIGLQAGALLGLDLPRADKRLLALVETDGCFADGVSVATGCWLGRRTLRLLDYGRVAAMLVDISTGRCGSGRTRRPAPARSPGRRGRPTAGTPSSRAIR
jgi:formylmethanofuran dehydrogenase subunit E